MYWIDWSPLVSIPGTGKPSKRQNKLHVSEIILVFMPQRPIS